MNSNNTQNMWAKEFMKKYLDMEIIYYKYMDGNLTKYLFEEMKDPRSTKYFLLNSLYKPTTICLVYLVVVNILGPYLMKNRPPFNVKIPIIIFNVFQIIANLTILILGLPCFGHYSDYRCGAVDFSDGPASRKEFNLVFSYHILKYTDLLDTCFFVLKKNFHQVTFLHVYHHITMIWISWFGAAYYPGGHSLHIGLLNLTVHTVMYFYYLITVLNTEATKRIWWKKHITQLQMVQFGLASIIFLGPIMWPCKYPKYASFLVIGQNVIFMYLFGRFYYNNYLKSSNSKEKQN